MKPAWLIVILSTLAQTSILTFANNAGAAPLAQGSAQDRDYLGEQLGRCDGKVAEEGSEIVFTNMLQGEFVNVALFLEDNRNAQLALVGEGGEGRQEYRTRGERLHLLTVGPGQSIELQGSCKWQIRHAGF